jgi:hypothetical protein
LFLVKIISYIIIISHVFFQVHIFFGDFSTVYTTEDPGGSMN